MNAQNAHEYLPLIYALANGKIIQFRNAIKNEWEDLETVDFSYSTELYRIKPPPRTFEMWLYPSTGRMYPVVDDLAIGETGEWLDVEDLNTDSYDPVVPLRCRFERVGGRMYPVVDDLAIGETGEWELITVQEVIA